MVELENALRNVFPARDIEGSRDHLLDRFAPTEQQKSEAKVPRLRDAFFKRRAVKYTLQNQPLSDRREYRSENGGKPLAIRPGRV